MKVRIAPSILSADFGRLAEEIRMCEEGGADFIHLDVMDGRFVPNITFGEKVIASARKATKLPLDVHMMVLEPENYFESFAAAGATGMTIHVEAAPHLQRQLSRIRELGCLAGAAVNPGTSLGGIREVAADLDLLLVMTVNPGFGGQEFIPASVNKVARARHILDEMKSRAALEVDGGIARDTIEKVWRAGADTFVAGNAVFTAQDPKAEIEALRRICLETV
jgi:ribulose-phosphate 3-epimerase